MTEEIKKAIKNPKFITEVDLKEFYENFICEFQLRVNAYQLVEIVMPIAKHIFDKGESLNIVYYLNKPLEDRKEAFEFLSKIETIVKRDKQALIRVWAGQIELHLMNKDSAGKCIDIAQIRVRSFDC